MNCRLCDSTQIEYKFHAGKEGDRFPVYECRDCRFQFRDLDSREAASFYTEEYYTGRAQFSYLDERKMEEPSRAVWNRRIRLLKKMSRAAAGEPFLDVGCSFGGLLACARDLGFDPYGMEISGYSADWAGKRFGSERVMIGNVEDYNLPEKGFAMVTMIEVAEHLSDPVKAFRNIHRSMRPGGVLLVQTADMDGLQAKMGGRDYHYYLPGHLSYFTRHNLRKALLLAGFNRTRFFGGVEFGLLPKLIKSRASFSAPADYFRWARISLYHLASKINLFGLRLTSSMVMAAWK